MTTYSMTIQGVSLDSTSINDLLQVALDYGVCPSTEIYKNGVAMKEKMADFLGC